MDTRRFRDSRRFQMLAQARWWGWVLLMMFVLVQLASTEVDLAPDVGHVRMRAP